MQKGSYLLSEMEYGKTIDTAHRPKPGCWASAKSTSQYAVTLTYSRRSVLVAADLLEFFNSTGWPFYVK